MRQEVKTIYGLIALVALSLASCGFPSYFPEIREHKSQKAKTMDFTNQGLSSLPDLSNFEKLETLILTGNPKLPWDSIGHLIPSRKLKVLVLDSNHLTSLPSWISSLSIDYISIAKNPKLNFERLASLLKTNKKLTRINLSHNHLKYLPQNFKDLKSLETVTLHHNNLNNDSTFLLLSRLCNLKWLNLSYNKIETLSPSIGCLTQVRYLYIENNNISKIPDALTNMTNLWSIYMAHNKLRFLPETILNTPSLRLFVASSNLIKSIPTEFWKVKETSLEIIVLSNNPLPNIEKEKAKNYFKKLHISPFYAESNKNHQ